MTTRELVDALATRYASPAWAFLPDVANGTAGYKGRTADAIAMSLWPSRGLELHGFEVKVSRGDWLRELKNPEKADGIVTHCHRWWIVVGDDKIIQQGELPPTWGLLSPHGQGLRCRVEAPLLAVEPLDIPMLAAIFRRITQVMIPTHSINDRLRGEFDRGHKAGEQSGNRELQAYERLKKDVAEFEAAVGMTIQDSSWHAVDATTTGRAVKWVIDHGHEQVRCQLESFRANVQCILREIDRALEDVK